MVWSAGENEFRGESASMTFDPGVGVREARLERDASAHFELQRESPLVPGMPGDAVSEIDLLARDWLAIEWKEMSLERGAGYELNTEGPSTVRSRDFRLRSGESGVQGFLYEGDQTAEFSATSGVEVETQNGKLQAAAFRVWFASRGDDDSYLHGTASGGARLIGWLPDNRSYTLTTDDRLEVEATKDGGWRILEGTNIDVALEGEEAFTAHADRIVNFDVDAFTFVAEGSIRLTNKRGVGGGERLVVRGENRYLLTGSEQQRAYFQGPGRSVSGLSIELLDEDSLRARGKVIAEGQFPPDEDAANAQRYRLEMEELDLDRLVESTLRMGVDRHVYTLAARGGVTGSMTRRTLRDTIRADDLLVRRLELRDVEREEPLEVETRLRANGAVEGTFQIQIVGGLVKQ